jgi:flagella basal body P-ring formation protein FlgA
LHATSAQAAWQDLSQLTEDARGWLASQVRPSQPNARVEVIAPDARIRLAACAAPEFARAPGASLRGPTLLVARCMDPAWSLNLNARVAIVAPAVHVRRALPAGQALAPQDLELREIDIARHANPPLGRIEDAAGRVLNGGMGAGMPLFATQLRNAIRVKVGQKVSLVTSGPGIQVRSEGRALASASVGDSLDVRTASGRVVSGRLREDGSVEVAP